MVEMHQRRGKREEENDKREEPRKKKDQGTEGEISYSNRVMRDLTGDEEKDEERKKEETRSGPPAKLPWTNWWSDTTRIDHTVDLF